MNRKKVEIMDTTLRDGEQTSGMSFSEYEKLTISKLLLKDLKVDRIEVASARVSSGEFNAVKKIIDWAKSENLENKVEILTFIDSGISIDWMIKSGAKIQNLLSKGSINHLKYQLKKTPKEHFNDVEQIIEIAIKNKIDTNIYLEDWSNGMKSSRDYVFSFLDFLKKMPVKRVLLPDTLGILNPAETFNFLNEIIKEYPNIHFDFHAHNDYDLSVANTLEGMKAGCHGIHTTINGMGERAGNTPMASIVAAIKDFLPNYSVAINEEALFRVSKLVSTFSGFRIPPNKPIVGDFVFTQTAGIHADGDTKKNLYFNDLLPERFGRKRKYALGKTSGKANIKKNIDELGLKLSDENLKKVTQKIIELGDKKEKVTTEDLPYIISDVLNTRNINEKIKIISYYLKHRKNEKPSADIEIEIEGKIYSAKGTGDGQFDAFINAVNKLYKKNGYILPILTDYSVTIPPGSHSDALCESIITWKNSEKEFITRGLDSDQTVSAIKATEKMLNII